MEVIDIQYISNLNTLLLGLVLTLIGLIAYFIASKNTSYIVDKVNYEQERTYIITKSHTHYSREHKGVVVYQKSKMYHRGFHIYFHETESLILDSSSKSSIETARLHVVKEGHNKCINYFNSNENKINSDIDKEINQ
jgi:hypothetical protein